MANTKFYDITAVFSNKLPIYGGGKGDPGVMIEEHTSMARGDRCNVSKITFGNHTGTHADMPKHFIDDGLTCETMPIHHFFGKARVLDLRPFLQGKKQVSAEDLQYFDIKEGEIILLNTGNTNLMLDSVFTREYVSLSIDAAAFLTEKKIKTVGIDYLSIEAGGGGSPVHKRLLGNNIAVLEGLLLAQVPQGTYTLSALPLKFENGNGSPVRAVLADDTSLELVIFDMDGLLLDTEPISKDGWCEAGKQMGFDMGEELYKRMIGTNVESCKERMKNYLGYTFDFDEAYAIRTSYVKKCVATHGVKLKNGVEKILDTLDALGIKKCVATSTEEKRAKELLTMAGVIDRFDYIIGGDKVKKGKPDPEIFLTAARDIKPENCLVLEDSQAGVEAGHKAGMRVIVVPDMYSPGKDSLARVCAVCEDLEKAAEFIRGTWRW